MLDRLLKRDRLVALGALAAVTAVAWGYLVWGAGMGMSGLAMTAMAGWPGQPAMAMAPPPWDLPYALLMVAMWAVMMVAMMLPSAAPMLLLHRAVQRRRGGAVPTGLFAAGYLAVWTAASIAFAGLQGLLTALGQIDGMLQAGQPWLAALLLIAAGLYQFTPLKGACLASCRAPFAFLQRHSRPGRRGAFVMGVVHGTHCLGCCWALMALLFVGGVMNLWWVGALALYVLVEKLGPAGTWVARATGLLLCLWGAALLIA